jgi:hypothetical protein
MLVLEIDVQVLLYCDGRFLVRQKARELAVEAPALLTMVGVESSGLQPFYLYREG